MKNQGLASAVSLSGWRSKREISSGHYHQHFLDAAAILLLNLPLTISGQTPTWRHMIPANLAHPLSGGHLMIIALVTPSSLCKILFSCREVITNTLLGDTFQSNVQPREEHCFMHTSPPASAKTLRTTFLSDASFCTIPIHSQGTASANLHPKWPIP